MFPISSPFFQTQSIAPFLEFAAADLQCDYSEFAGMQKLLKITEKKYESILMDCKLNFFTGNPEGFMLFHDYGLKTVPKKLHCKLFINHDTDRVK